MNTTSRISRGERIVGPDVRAAVRVVVDQVNDRAIKDDITVDSII